MDPWVSAFTNLGIGGALCFAMVWFLRYLVTVTLPELVRTFSEQLEKERAASERRHSEVLVRIDRLDAAQIQRHADNLTALKEQRHLIRGLDTSLATFMAVIGEHMGLLHRKPADPNEKEKGPS